MAYGRNKERTEDPRFARVGGLWAGRDRKDNEMFTGGLLVSTLKDYLDEIGFEDRRDDERLPVMAFANTYKEEEKHPDFNLYLGDPDRKRGGSRGRSQDRDEKPTRNTDDRNEETEERQAPSRRAPKPTRTAKKPEPKSRKGGDRKRLRLDR